MASESLNIRMPDHIYPGSYNEVMDQLGQQQNFGGPEFLRRDAFEQRVNSTDRQTPPLMVYPLDLGDNLEYQFSIRFDIYETGGTELTRQRKVQKKIESSIQGSVNSASGSLSVGQFADLAIAAGGGIFDAISGAFGGTGTIQNAATQGKGRDSFVEEATGIGGLTEQKASIYMYLPGAIGIGYKFDYEDADLSAMDILKGLRSLPINHSCFPSTAGAVSPADFQPQGFLLKVWR